MDTQHVIDLLPDYLDQVLDTEQKRKVEAHIKGCQSCQLEMEQMKVLFEAFDQEKEVVPTQRIRSKFLQHLEQEVQEADKIIPLVSSGPKKKGIWADFLKIAAGIALLIGSYGLGHYQKAQKGNADLAVMAAERLEFKQTAMLSLMGNKSASKRIQGVNYIEEFADPDTEIVQALTDRMLQDENANVRRTAMEALGKFTASDVVKDAFIQALETEKDAGIQIAIIKVLVTIQEKNAVAPMQRLLERDDTQSFVKEQIKLALPSII